MATSRRARPRTAGVWALVLAGLLVSCGKSKPAITSSGGPSDDGGTGQGLSACLPRPEQLPRPPGDQLPCELIPPGLSL